jgi:hypothetical protein
VRLELWTRRARWIRCNRPTYFHRLHAHYHEECELGGGVVSFRAGAKYWMPNMIDTGHAQVPRGYECRDSVLIATVTFVWEEIETFAPNGT